MTCYVVEIFLFSRRKQLQKTELNVAAFFSQHLTIAVCWAKIQILWTEFRNIISHNFFKTWLLSEENLLISTHVKISGQLVAKDFFFR